MENQPQVTRVILRRAASEVFSGQEVVPGALLASSGRRWPLVAAGALGGVIISAVLWQLAAHDAKPGMQSAQAASAAPLAAGGAAVAVPKAGAPAPALAPAASLPPAANAMPTAAAPDGGGKAAALRQLAGMWGLALVDGDPCPTAARLNLRCLQTKGGIDDLRLLDRPAVLTLRDDPVAPNYVLLTALDKRNATITPPGGAPQTIGLDALAARFGGEFTTFWRAPRSWRDEVTVGDHGPDVDWLAKRLSQLYELKKPQENQPLDAALRSRLTEFQTEQHLKADGVAGPKTFIRLYQLGGVQEPRLLARAGKADAVAGK